MFLRNFLIALSRNAFMKRLVTRNFIARRVARRFVAGETWEDASRAMDRLMGEGMDIALDFLGENVHTPDEAHQATEAYLQVLHRLHERGENWYVSLKLTQIGMDLGEELCLANLERILAEAARSKTFVRTPT
jgi:proline dehydrogenase